MLILLSLCTSGSGRLNRVSSALLAFSLFFNLSFFEVLIIITFLLSIFRRLIINKLVKDLSAFNIVSKELVIIINTVVNFACHFVLMSIKNEVGLS